ncbi:methylated-DNA--[protein]-cysteine S-methyltransferase [Devosia sp.]|uniref:methylated-DNA--[protein]-cysteine S-methyltransferase n=1 Tax=Devosia sp. TaxID=1871048 RepID=UPI001B119FC9|nr:methylated-DNA--[protein]-cysteine S-methyltransferase [Devosia sp.]MBO9587739.1 methylated-DNA--[protein]-cysteine S-methyltransferase [Devosia sp.]
MYSTTFATALGEFALVWTDCGVRRVFLPGGEPSEIAGRMAKLGAEPAEPDRTISALLDQIEDYAEGEEVDFSAVSLDLTGVPDFHRRCYDILLTIGWGKTTTYGDMARQLGDVGLSRAVGQAMGANPIPLIIPCHRVLAAGNGAGGFSAPGGTSSKRVMLALEGVSMGAPPGQMQFAF